VLGLATLGAYAYGGPAALQAKYTALHEQLRSNSFHRALHIDSSQNGDTLQGDVYAVLDYPFATVTEALKNPADWCDIMLLPFNTKYCRAAISGDQALLKMGIGRRYDQPARDAFRIDFAWRPVVMRADYFETRLTAAQGPLGTHDYRIAVSTVPLAGGRTFMRLSYSYGYGFASRLAMRGYLATAGADKVGFTVTGRDGNGQPIYMGGVRGAVERNAMRYYLAIDAYLASLKAPAGERLEKRIQTWFDSTERYARQLHEMDRGTYVAMKRGEYERQQAAIR
jgi:hypothetical protein